MHRSAFGLVCALAALHPATAPGAPLGDPGVYVSERFKKLAVRVARDYLADEIARSCPAQAPLCAPLARRLGDAVGAAIEGNDEGVRAALNGLFFEASVLGVVHVTTGETWSGSSPVLDPTAVRPLVACLATSLTGQPSREACSVAQGAVELLAALFKRFPCQGGDRATCEGLVEAARGGRAIEPPMALRALAGLVTSKEIQRPDLRLLLLELAALSERGPEAGLAPALARYLVASHSTRSAASFAAQGLVDFAPGVAASRALWEEASLRDWRAVAARCGQPTDGLVAWQMGHQELLERWRRQVLLGQAIDLAPLDRLLEVEARCQDESDAARLRELRRYVRYFTAPLRVRQALARYGTGALAAAAALDHVRTRDAAGLERDLHRTLVYAAATLAQYRLVDFVLRGEAETGTRLRAKDVPLLGDALAACEVAALGVLLGATLPPSDRQIPVPEGQCLSLVDGKPRPWQQPDARPPTTPPDEWLRLKGPALVSLLGFLSDKGAGGADRDAQRPQVSELVIARVANALAEGEGASARQVLLRAGVDLLAEHLEAVTSDVVGASEARCRDDLRARSIFTRLGAGCAVHALVTGAYRPVVEYYWAGGRDAAGLATAGYRGLLARQSLRYTPLILNVGLGATWVTGSSATWGHGGYAALTVIDKIGVAFCKRLDERTTFEFGAFAGGFVDALVRTATDSGKEHRYWLLGLTAGWPRVRGLDVGLEVHAGAAMPFELARGSSYGFAAGAAMVVPFDTFLAE